MKATSTRTYVINRTCFVLILTAILGLGCSEKKRELQNSNRKDVLDTLAVRVIIPAFEDLHTQAQLLEKAARTFTETPSENTLGAVRNQWLETTSAWKRASTYTFGPIEDHFLSGGIYYSGVHYANIEKSIQTAGKIDNAFINSQGSSLKGLKAIEYLLYKDDRVLADFGASTARKNYLQALTENLTAQTQKVLDLWTSGEQPYRETFVNATGRELNSSLCILVNKTIQQVNMIRDERLAMPMGMHREQTPRTDMIEGRLSKSSVTLLKNEIRSIQNLYSNKGINTLLDQMEATYEGEPLSARIDQQFETVYQLTDALPNGLEEAIVTDKEAVKNIHDQLKKLQILLEVDVVNHLGIILTFSDNDGD